MHVTIVQVNVKTEHIGDFIRASRLNHLASIPEPGNRRFDVLQSTVDASQFVLYEACASAGHATAHKDTAHYLQWRETVAGWMVTPRTGVTYAGLCPE